MRVALMLVTVPVMVNAAAATGGQYDPGCVVEKEKDLSWHWSGAEVGVWAPPCTHEDILTVSITYQNYKPSEDSDKIQINRKSAFISSFHPSIPETTRTVKFTRELASGWVQLKLTLGVNITVARSGPEALPLLTLPVHLHVDSLHLRGSNLTLDCPQGAPAWLVSGEREAVVPLAAGVEEHHLSLLSRGAVQPSLTLASQVWRLGWTGAQLTVAGEQQQLPLPPHHHHHLTLLCSGHGFNSIRCCLLADENEEQLLDILVVSAWPTSLAVGVEEGQSLVVHAATTTGESTGSEKSEQETDDTNAVLVVSVSMVVVVVVVAVVVGVLFVRRKWLQGDVRKRPLLGVRRGEARRRWEMEDLCKTSSEGAFTDDPLVCGRLWAAVAGGIKEEVEELLSNLGPDPRVVPPGHDTSTYTEAHFRGNSEVLAAIHTHMQPETAGSTDEVVEEVLKVFERRVKEVFWAAERGQYHDHGGVDLLLRGYGLPATLRDHRGFTLLHHAAHARLPAGNPLWLPVDLRSLLQHHQCNSNAVDHTGQTALHVLAKSEGGDKTWLTMAGTLLEFGADPGILDYNSRTPHDVARVRGNTELAKMLVTEVEKLPRTLSFQLEGDPLSRAILGGDRDETLLLLSEGWSVLAGCVMGTSPILTSHTCHGLPAILPAIMRKVLCDNVQDEISRTEAQGKNTTSNALCKKLGTWKKYVYKYGFDVVRIASTTSTRDQLCLAARMGLPYSCQLLATTNTRSVTLPPAERQLFVLGTESRRMDVLYTLYRDLRISPHSVTDEVKNYSSEFQRLMLVGEIRLLRSVVFNDMALRQSLGCEVVDLFGEDRACGAEDAQCLTEDRPSLRVNTPTFTDDTMLVTDDFSYLTEDTLLLPLPRNSQPISEDNAFSSEGCKHITDGNPVTTDSTPYMKRLILKDRLAITADNRSSEGIPSIIVNAPLITDDNLLLTSTGPPPSNDLLALISHLGLVCTLHRAIPTLPFGLNAAVHKQSGSTLLNLAASSGQMGMVEYLLFHGADPGHMTRSGLTAAHMAAIRGHKHCMKYIIEYSQRSRDGILNNPGSIDMTPRELKRCYKENLKKSNILTCDESYKILKQTDLGTRASLILQQKFQKLNIVTEEDFLQYLKKGNHTQESLQAHELLHSVEYEIKILAKEVGEVNPDMKSRVVGGLTIVEGTEPFLQDSLDFFLELDDHHALDGGDVTITVGEEYFDLKVSSSKEPELFLGSNFIQAFEFAVKKTLGNYEMTSLILLPDFEQPIDSGVSLTLLWWQKPHAGLLRVRLTPVVRAPWPVWGQSPPKTCRKYVEYKNYVYLKNTRHGKWEYEFPHSRKFCLQMLDGNHTIVLTGLYFVIRLLTSYWWLPKQLRPQPGRAISSAPLGISVPSPQVLVALFVEEMESSEANMWGEDYLLKRIVSILRRSRPFQPREAIAEHAIIKYLETKIILTNDDPQEC